MDLPQVRLAEVLLILLLIVLVMGFHRRGSSIRPVHRIKHVVDNQLGIVLNTLTTKDLIESVDAPLLPNTDQVESGSTVNGIYLKVECYATTSGALANVYMYIMKNPGGNLASPAANFVGADDNKKYVIHQEMVMLEQSVNGNPRTVFNGVIVIPKGYRRFAINDKLTISLFAPGVDINVCYQCHYKEFR